MANGDNTGASTPEEWTDDDARGLQGFIVQIRDLLQAIVDDKRHIPEALLDDVTAAWPQARAELNRLHDSLDPGTLANQPDRRGMLQDHGLSGTALRMKLRAWRARFFRFGRRMDRPWLRSVLRWADTILESLGDVMPGGGAAKEFKQSIENFLADAETDDAALKRQGSKK